MQTAKTEESTFEARMKGIQFLNDVGGRKSAVVIDLKTHGELWEDIYDSLVASARANEPRESLELVKRKLSRKGKRGD